MGHVFQEHQGGRQSDYFPGKGRGFPQKRANFYQPNRPPRFNSFPNRSTQTNFGEIICSRCRRVAHFARNCPSVSDPRLPSPFPRPQPRFNSNFQKGMGNRPVRRSGPTPFNGFTTCSRPQKQDSLNLKPVLSSRCEELNKSNLNKIPFIPSSEHACNLIIDGKVQDMPVRILLDTGAAISVVSQELWEKIPPEKRPKLRRPLHAGIKTVAGNIMHLIGSAEINYQIGNSEYRFSAAVIPFPVVLGLDFLRKFGAVINLGNEEITFNSKGVASTPTPSRIPQKLLHCWHGSFEIVKKMSPVHFRLKTMTNKPVTMSVHANRMKVYVDPKDRPIDPPDDNSDGPYLDLDQLPRDSVDEEEQSDFKTDGQQLDGETPQEIKAVTSCNTHKIDQQETDG